MNQDLIDRYRAAMKGSINERVNIALAAGFPGIADAILAVLTERERELLEIKGPCSNRKCSLHYAHSGPCNCSESS